MNKKGQAMSEMVIILPVLIALAGLAMAVAYTCWQGIKVQEAANYAARMEGQERVAGATNVDSINRTNGVGSGQVGDTDISNTTSSDSLTASDLQSYHHDPNAQSVYGRYRAAVRGMFTSTEQNQLLVPMPKQGTDIDQINVTRVMTSWSIFGFKIPQVVITGTAYGGEDTNMYALPRWGCTGSAPTCSQSDQYWSQSLHQYASPNQQNPIQ